eukprot:c32437_g1_i1 orf=3-236(-)
MLCNSLKKAKLSGAYCVPQCTIEHADKSMKKPKFSSVGPFPTARRVHVGGKVRIQILTFGKGTLGAGTILGQERVVNN